MPTWQELLDKTPRPSRTPDPALVLAARTRYLEGKTLRAISEELGVAQSRVQNWIYNTSIQPTNVPEIN